jgi:hypothetical protein
MDNLGLRELEWTSPDIKDAILHLQIISAVEEAPQRIEEIRHTFSFCQFDFRRTLMLLQLSSLSQAKQVETARVQLESQSRSLPRAVSMANGLLKLGTFEPALQLVDRDGILQQISPKEGMVRTSRIFEDADGILDALFNTTWEPLDSLETDKAARDKADLQRLLEISKLADAKSHALLLAEVSDFTGLTHFDFLIPVICVPFLQAHEDIRRNCVGGCLSSAVACIAAGCLHLGEESTHVDWFLPANRFVHMATIKSQQEHCADLVYPRACGIGRLSSVMLDYAPWVRDMCKVEEEKKLHGASRRRRATHHLSSLSPLALDSFSSSLILTPQS